MDGRYANTRRKGIYLLPNLFTTGGLFAGFYSIVAAIDGNFALAGWAVFVAMLFDGLDGRVARWTRTESPFLLVFPGTCISAARDCQPRLLASSRVDC